LPAPFIWWLGHTIHLYILGFKMKSGNLTNSTLSIVFLTIIFSVMTLFLFLDKEEINKVENRKLAELPTFDLGKLDPFPRQYDDYYTDHFPFRSQLVEAFNKFNYSNFKISPLPDKVVVGLNDFLFMSGKQMEVYQGKKLFTQTELNTILDELKYRRDFCTKEGAKFYFVIVPQKSSIYEENIPIKYKTTRQKTIRTQLEDFLDEQGFPYIDPTDYLISKKTTEDLVYLRTDNHWNNLGAFYASQHITDAIKKDFPYTSPLVLEQFKVTKNETAGGNLAQMLNMAEELKDEDYAFEKIKGSVAVSGKKAPYEPPKSFAYPWEYEEVYLKPDANDLKILIIRESFGTKQRQFYRESFGKTVMIFDAWQHRLNADIIENEKPDIVVIQILENMLGNLLTYPAEAENINK